MKAVKIAIKGIPRINTELISIIQTSGRSTEMEAEVKQV